MLERRRDKHARRYGKRFKEDYGWAAPWFRGKKTRVNFAMLEARVDFDRARPYFKLASDSIHAGPLGVLSNHDEVDRYVTGPSLHRLTHAAEPHPYGWPTYSRARPAR